MNREVFEAALADIFNVRWYATVNDLIGGWSISNVNKPASGRNPELGDIEIGDFLTEELAEYIADMHNRTICPGDGIPTMCRRLDCPPCHLPEAPPTSSG